MTQNARKRLERTSKARHQFLTSSTNLVPRPLDVLRACPTKQRLWHNPKPDTTNRGIQFALRMSEWQNDERRVVQKRAGIRVERHRKEGVSFERETAQSTTKSKDKIVVRGKTGCDASGDAQSHALQFTSRDAQGFPARGSRVTSA